MDPLLAGVFRFPRFGKSVSNSAASNSTEFRSGFSRAREIPVRVQMPPRLVDVEKYTCTPLPSMPMSFAAAKRSTSVPMPLEPRSQRIRIRFSTKEDKRLRDAALEAGLHVSELVRLGLRRKVRLADKRPLTYFEKYDEPMRPKVIEVRITEKEHEKALTMGGQAVRKAVVREGEKCF